MGVWGRVGGGGGGWMGVGTDVSFRGDGGGEDWIHRGFAFSNVSKGSLPLLLHPLSYRTSLFPLLSYFNSFSGIRHLLRVLKCNGLRAYLPLPP